MELKNKYSIPPKIGKKVKIKTEKLFTFVFSKNISDWMPKVAETREKQREYRGLYRQKL